MPEFKSTVLRCADPITVFLIAYSFGATTILAVAVLRVSVIFPITFDFVLTIFTYLAYFQNGLLLIASMGEVALT